MWSALSADNSAASAAAKRQRKISAKVGEIAEGSTASKAFQIRDSDAFLTLVESIIHGDHEHWEILLTKQRDKVPVQSRLTRYLTQVLLFAHDQHMEPSFETISNRDTRGIVAAEVEAKHRNQRRER